MDLEGVEGVDGKLKVWIRRVWTLEMVSRLTDTWEIHDYLGPCSSY